MKKIVVPFEGSAYHGELLDFAKALSRRSKIYLTAAFVPMIDYAQLWPPAAAAEAHAFLPLTDEFEKIARSHARLVEQFCETNSIGCRVHLDTNDFAMAAIRKETRFADLLLLSSRHFFDNITIRQPNAYMQKALHDTECPVLLLPEDPALPDSIVLAYDGTPGSVKAIRQFSQLFPEFTNIPTTLVYLDEKEKGSIPDNDLIRELGNVHFRNFRMLHLAMRTDEFYDSWISMKPNPWLVAGAFGRSEWSRLISHSFVHRLIKEHKVPLFLAHC